eukprot:SAG25_NODE_589_length_6722_cov_19.193417_1_plen_171_part_00
MQNQQQGAGLPRRTSSCSVWSRPVAQGTGQRRLQRCLARGRRQQYGRTTTSGTGPRMQNRRCTEGAGLPRRTSSCSVWSRPVAQGTGQRRLQRCLARGRRTLAGLLTLAHSSKRCEKRLGSACRGCRCACTGRTTPLASLQRCRFLPRYARTEGTADSASPQVSTSTCPR